MPQTTLQTKLSFPCSPGQASSTQGAPPLPTEVLGRETAVVLYVLPGKQTRMNDDKPSPCSHWPWRNHFLPAPLVPLCICLASLLPKEKWFLKGLFCPSPNPVSLPREEKAAPCLPARAGDLSGLSLGGGPWPARPHPAWPFSIRLKGTCLFCHLQWSRCSSVGWLLLPSCPLPPFVSRTGHSPDRPS